MWHHHLSAGSDDVHVRAGAHVFRAGHTPKIALLGAGLVRVFLLTSAGRQLTIRYARQGELIGLTGHLARTDQWNAEAITDASLKVLTIEQLRSAATHDPELPWQIAEHVATWTAETLLSIADTDGQPMAVRVARHLREIALREPDGHAVAHISHQRLADAVGTVREVVSRELNALRRRGIIETSTGSVTVIDEARLADLAAGRAQLVGRQRMSPPGDRSHRRAIAFVHKRFRADCGRITIVRRR